MSWRRIYLISYQQFMEIQNMEGPSYQKKIFLGKENGTLIYTFTSQDKRMDTGSPSVQYIDVILSGLKDAYTEKAEIVLETYLYSRGILEKDDYRILDYVRSSTHGVSVDEITKHTIPKTRTKKSVNKLISYGVLKQDGRSIAAWQKISNGDAVVYTAEEKRALLDLLAVICSLN